MIKKEEIIEELNKRSKEFIYYLEGNKIKVKEK